MRVMSCVLQKEMALQVTCGGLQSAHTAAVAFACAERGITAHLLVRGERAAVPTGYQPPIMNMHLTSSNAQWRSFGRLQA